MTHTHAEYRNGFTIVELLIVVVIIGILASITVVSYNGVTGRANDATLQSDLRNMGQAVMIAGNGMSAPPTDEATLSVIGIKASKGSYGNDLVSGGMKYNLLYCSTVASYQPAGFAFVAASKSGNVFVFQNLMGKVSTYPTASWTGGWGTICPDVLGVAAGNSNTGIWIYENSIWKIWL